MNRKVKIKSGVVVIERNDGIFVGHMQNSVLFTNREIRPLIRLIQVGETIEKLIVESGSEPGVVSEVITTLHDSQMLEYQSDLHPINQFVISHMNEVGILLAAMLNEQEFSLTTLDERRATISDVRGQFIRVMDIGKTYSEILEAQRQEIRNSRSREFSPAARVANGQQLTIITTYPEPELLAKLTVTGSDYFAVFATPFGAMIGPYVRNGTSPCFHCIELTRSESDNEWQKVAATLFMQRHEPIAMNMALLAASAAAPFLRSISQGEVPHEILASTLSITWEQRDDTQISRAFRTTPQKWTLHPECSCHWAGSLSTRAR